MKDCDPADVARLGDQERDGSGARHLFAAKREPGTVSALIQGGCPVRHCAEREAQPGGHRRHNVKPGTPQRAPEVALFVGGPGTPRRVLEVALFRGHARWRPYGPGLRDGSCTLFLIDLCAGIRIRNARRSTPNGHQTSEGCSCPLRVGMCDVFTTKIDDFPIATDCCVIILPTVLTEKTFHQPSFRKLRRNV